MIPSRLATVQSLVLVTYFDVGVGAMLSAWQSSGLALRTAQDIGLNRSVDKWQLEGANMFSSDEKEMCRRIWYCVMLLDK